MQNSNEEQDTPSLDELYDAHGSHILHEDGSITFLYRPSDPSIKYLNILHQPLNEWKRFL